MARRAYVRSPGRHLISFGLLVFLVGHGILVWAFLAGHFGAWSIGNLVTVFGVAMSLLAASAKIGDLQSQIDQIKQQSLRGKQPIRGSANAETPSKKCRS